MMKGNSTTKGSRGETIMEICGSHKCMSDMKELTVFPLSNTILLRGVRISGMVDNITISTKGMERGFNKLNSVINTKNLKCSGILSDNLPD